MITMSTLVFLAVVIGIILLIVKIRVARNKPSEQRSAFEKILATLSVKHRENMENAANAIRTPEITKTEAIQKTKDAIRDLENGYRTQLTEMISNKAKLEEMLPKLKEKPGVWEGKARKAKRDSEKEEDPELKEDYKKNAMLYLSLKSKAAERITKTEKYIKSSKTAITKAQVAYEGKKAILDDMLIDLESLQAAVLEVRFNQNMEVIRSLQREVVTQLRERNAEIEASNIISGTSDNNITGDVDSSAYEDEFNNL